MSQTLGLTHGNMEERYSHILQPIRDLAKNFNVDIAHFLEEYLEELDKIEITFDDGVTTMNFSEAALLIQGSAGVYAKKVEYLHALVYQVLDLITQKKKLNNPSGEGQGEDNTQHAGDDEQYLALDDIAESEGTCLKEQELSSDKSVRPIPEMPTRLIPLEEAEKGENCLFNTKGEIMGNYCDFNINTGFIAEDGSILFERADRALIHMITRQQETLQALVEEEQFHRADDSLAVAADDEINPQEEPVNSFTEVAALPDVSQPSVPADAIEDVPRKSQRKRAELVRSCTTVKSTADPWILLDPHEKSNALERPLVKKKPFKVPARLKESAVEPELPPLYEVVEKLFSHRSKFPKNPLKVPPFPELEDAFWEEHKLREAARREEIKKMKKEEQEEMEAIESFLNEPEEPAVEAFDADEDEEIPQIQLCADLFSEGHDLRPTSGLNRGSSGNFSEDISLSYEDLVQKHVEKFLASAAEYANITELSRRVAEWEEKIQPKLREEETHEPFDIHKYGTYILEQLVRGEKRPFKELVQGKAEYEICRYTLATLQLANVYNVELELIPDQTGSFMDCLYVTLLSTKRHFEELEDYMAPSLKPHDPERELDS
ncbi:condensin-2 complex subunit H2-like isoform X2 [Biomphalaria glabrata]|nr:condensin-2 complex subunit H2-like isoform X2 [Biomphalaria glabrata]KAI8781345.1 condensin-2 complex subunit H2 [Biomphalaria glabrata]